MDEKELIQGILQGAEGAREALDRLYRKRLYATAVHFLGWQDPEAEDVVQDTFVTAFEKMGSFEGRSGLYTWLNHICVNACFDRLRKRRRLILAQADELEQYSRARLESEARQRDEDELRRGRLEFLGGLIGSMSGSCRDVLNLRFSEGLALHAIRDRLKLPLGTVASRLARCQEALKKMARKAYV